ncbi:hypothetical protein vseg_012628 [Gypsophila vaccaria]
MPRDSKVKSSDMELENVPVNRNLNPSKIKEEDEEEEEEEEEDGVIVEETSSRPPLQAIENPRAEGTPLKHRGWGTPGKKRFGYECSSEISHSSRLTSRSDAAVAVAVASATPSKSVTKPPHPASLSRRPARPAPLPSLVNTLHVSHFDLKEDPSFWMDHNVQVIIRARPLNPHETSLFGYNRCLRQDSSHSISWIGHPETRFTFDHVACETVDQEMLFRMAGLPMVENCLSGYNSCMFAYGQTGSGKTYTMLGEMEDVEFTPSPHRGMTPRIFEFLFARIRAEEESRRDEELKYSCKCSFLEIYNEQITDLLDPSSTNLLLREDVKKGVYVENLSEFEVHTVGDVLGLLIQGSSNRKVAATNMNRESSRSHCVFICIIESKWERDSVTNYRFARLNLVDLAGSERQKSSGAEGERLKEAANINKSLSTLGHVIMLLVDIAHGKPRHIPYRDSRLTFLLQDSLGGNSKTMIIANVSPSVCCAAETLNTLKFAQRAKLIQNNAVVNEDSSGDVTVLQHQILLLKEELSALKRQNVSRTLAFDPSTSIKSHENNDKGIRSGNDQSEYLVESEWQGGARISPKQVKSLEMMLAGALRREQMAETSMKQLEAKIEQLNRLVRQREEDTRCTKMMLKFREDKIHRMESLLGEIKPVDAYLLEENVALSEEIQMLQTKVDRNPEVTRFAVENIRLLEELRRFQDFYEEGERDLLMNEVSELRAQLIRFHDNSIQQHVSITAQDATNNQKEIESFASKLTNTANELAECQTKLNSCLETNLKLSREIEELHAQLRNKDLQLSGLHNIPDSVKDLQVLSIASQSSGRDVDENRTEHGDVVTAEALVNLELELDILKIILKEEKLSHSKLEEIASSFARDAQIAEQQVFHISKQHQNAEANLIEAKSVIQALESQQLLSIAEIKDLKNRNCHHLELLCKQELEISALKEQVSGQEFTPCLKYSDCEKSPLQEQLKRMQASLDKAKRLNMWYRSDHAYQRSNEEEMDEIRRQAEAETAEVIVCLQEELSVLQERAYESDLREKETENKLLFLETELKELHEDFDRLSCDNKVLCQSVQQKETEIKFLADDWKLLSCEIEEALIEGHEALRNASNELSASTSSKRRCISEQVGKLIRQISDKESLIGDLNNCLEEANTKTSDMERMLMSLKGATIVLTEAHQQECCQKEKEIMKLKSELQASVSAKEEMYMSQKSGVESIQAVEVIVLSLQEAFNDFEKQCQGKLIALYHKLNKVEEHAKVAKCSWYQMKEMLEYELVDSKAVAAQKAVEASSLLVRFEEVQETMKEADMMINGLMIANKTTQLEIEDLRNMNIMLSGEIDRSVSEVRILQSANDLKDQNCINLERQLVLDASEFATIIEELQGLVSATQEASEKAVMSISHEVCYVKAHLRDTLSLMHSSLEDVWSELISKDCTLSVLHLCHIGVLSEAAKVENYEDDLNDICESNTLINDLREQNIKLKQNIEMQQVTKEGLLSDINNSLNQISREEGAMRELDLKLDSFKENLAVLQQQEESLLETCNLMGSKLAVLEEELNQSNLSVAASLVEQEKLQKSNAKLNECQTEVLSVELYAKDLELLIMALELQQLSQHNSDMGRQQQICCTALDSMVSEIITQNIFADLRQQLLLEKEMEVCCLQSIIQKAQDSESRVLVQLQALNILGSKVAKCAYGVETTELQSCTMLNQLEQNIMLVSDRMYEDSCQNMELVSKFLEELECIDYLSKEIASQNLSLKEMLLRKDEVLDGLLFDLHLLQESAVNSKDQQDQIEIMEGMLESTEYDLATKSRELNEAITVGEALEVELKEQRNVISSTKMDLENTNKTLNVLTEENEVLKSHVEDIMVARSSIERELCEKKNVIDSLEYELLEMGSTLGQMNDLVESLRSSLDVVNKEKDHLCEELLILEGKLETAHALAEESEAIAAEAREIAESRRIYAEEKDEEVQLLERSVQELDSTISVLENKVDVLKEDVERQRLQREELELELHSFKNQMQSVEFADSEIKRHADEKTRNLQEALTLIEVLQKDLAHKDTEVAQCRAHISELSLHAEAQACEYKQKFKELESMLEQFGAEAASNHERNASCNKLEKNSSKARGSSPFKGKASSSPFKGRGSGSPFKCIGLGLAHQLKSEKDEENNADRLRIEELEALAASRQKEIFMLNARLAATESMTHDVIRDLLGVKLDMSNCANLLDKQQVRKIAEMAQLDSVKFQDPEVANLKKQLNECFVEEKRLLEELDRRQTELVAAEIALEKLREQEMFLSTENNVLKRDLTNHKRQVIELEEEVVKLSGQQKLQQRIHHHAKIKEENNILKIQNEELGSKLRQAEAYLQRVRKELVNFRGNNGKTPKASYFSAIDR